LAAVYENGYVTICKGTWKIRVEKASAIPLTYGGRATFNIANVLPTVLAAFIRDFDIETIRMALLTFIPSPMQTPGRMNMFHFKNFTVMVDYAHNTHGFMAISDFLSKVDATPKIGIIAGVGDRRDEDIINLGRVAGGMFDEIVIRQDKNLRGRTEQAIIDLMTQGINEVSDGKKISIFAKEREAIEYAIRNAPPGAFVTICSDVVPDALEQIMQLKEEEENVKI
jgi:cyanophycin synthetase